MEIILSIMVIAAFILGIFLGNESRKGGYQDGQIDAMNGKQNYHLLEFPDGTRDYYHKDDLKYFNNENQNYILIK